MKRPYRLRWYGYASTDDTEARAHTATFATDRARRDKYVALCRYDLIVGAVSLSDAVETPTPEPTP